MRASRRKHAGTMIGRSILRLSFVGWLAIGTAGCTGILGEPSDGSGGALDPNVDQPSPGSRYRRLTHEEWGRTVAALMPGTEVDALAGSLRPDPRQGGFLFESSGYGLNVDPTLAEDYYAAASELALAWTSDAATLARLAPPTGSDEERARAFINEFGMRVHRRPIEPAQVDDYLAIFEVGKTSFDDMTGFAAGVRLVLEGMLTSPYFLYRVEDSTTVAGGTIPLSGFERASRLSYFLTGSMPHGELFAAAEDGTMVTPEGVAAQVGRRLELPSARLVAEAFFEAVFDVARYDRILPSAEAFPGISGPELAAAAREETRRFAREILFAGDGGITEMFTSRETFVNDVLASVYGLEGTFDGNFVRASLDPAERSGILTQVGFLASHATSVDPDPIHRGVFVAKRFSCLKIAAPPDAVPAIPPPMNQTNRQAVVAHTEQPGTACANCHVRIINPYGFPFESYDAVGAHRTMDRGFPIDTSARPFVGGEERAVANALELSSQLAESAEVHECLVGHVVEFAQGRKRGTLDDALVRQLGERSLREGLSFKEIFGAVASARSFLERSEAK